MRILCRHPEAAVIVWILCAAGLNMWVKHYKPFSCAYPRQGRGGSQLDEIFQMSVSPATFASSSRGIPRRSKARRNVQSPQRVGSASVSPPSWSCPEKPPRGDAQEASLSDARTTQASSSSSKGAAALLRGPYLNRFRSLFTTAICELFDTVQQQY